MGLFDWLFKKKDNSFSILPQSTQEETISESNQAPLEERSFKEDLCGYCNQPIGTERYRKISGKFIHKKCFKQGLKIAQNG